MFRAYGLNTLKALLPFALFLLCYPVWALNKPLVIGHRGAPGYRPEHTMASFELAIEQGADFIEPDLVMSKDGVLVVRHENEISGTTDVAIKFPKRKTTKSIDGKKTEGWFTEDFTLAELKTLRAKERLASRDHGRDGQFEILTFEEVIELAKKKKVGIYPEMKHPSYFASINLKLEPEVIRILKKHKLADKDAAVFLQCFELSSLIEVRKSISVKTVFLLDDPEVQAYDTVVKGQPKTYLSYVETPEALKKLAGEVSGVGPHKYYVVPRTLLGGLKEPTALLKQAHQLGLLVHVYTFRSDKEFLATAYDGDPLKEYRQFYELGVDGVFSDFPDQAVAARKAFGIEYSPHSLRR